jgi:hypothetical protein
MGWWSLPPQSRLCVHIIFEAKAVATSANTGLRVEMNLLALPCEDGPAHSVNSESASVEGRRASAA